MKSSWTSSNGRDLVPRPAGLCLLGWLAAFCAACGASAPSHSLADLTNPLLGAEYSLWLVGPISRIASAEEIKAYLALRDDAAAGAFVASFWARHNSTPERPRNALRVTFEERAAEADRRFSEAGVLGRRTDRGTVYVLYGPPAATEFEVSQEQGEPPLEVWSYGGGSPPGLDGRRPAARYLFVKRGELTVTYVHRSEEPRPQLSPPPP